MSKLPVKQRDFDVLDYKLPAIYFMPDKPKLGFLLWLYGSNSNKDKHQVTLERLARELNIPVFCFDYSGHGEAPFAFAKTTPAQHFLEVITVYDELCAEFGCGGGYVIGGSYGSYLLLQLLKYRQIVAGILRCPAAFKPTSFYTRWENLMQEDREMYRSTEAELRKHPLIERAATNKAPILIVEHGADNEIPPAFPRLLKEKLANSDYIVAEGIPHSLSSLSDEQKTAYADQLIAWLKKH